MKIKKKSSKNSVLSRDPAKESIFRSLVGILADCGVEVRRQELRRGPGWRAISGTCRLKDKPLVILDRRMSQDDQISFMIDKILDLRTSICPELLSKLPDTIALRLQSEVELEPSRSNY